MFLHIHNVEYIYVYIYILYVYKDCNWHREASAQRFVLYDSEFMDRLS